MRGPSVVSEEERDHDGNGFRSASWASWAPQLKETIKSEVEVSLAGSVLERVMKMDASFLEHLQRDHIPYRRDCRACLAGSFRGHVHRRVVAPDAWCLSLDVIGPARQGEDEVLKKVKYGLIGTLVVPDVLGKLLQPEDPRRRMMDEGWGRSLSSRCGKMATSRTTRRRRSFQLRGRGRKRRRPNGKQWSSRKRSRTQR